MSDSTRSNIPSNILQGPSEHGSSEIVLFHLPRFQRGFAISELPFSTFFPVSVSVVEVELVSKSRA